MELILISSTKLKVMLSADDMKKFDFDPKCCTDISGRAAFRSILKEARDKCGFDAIGEKVFVQYYPEKQGGCEMFVTKLSDTEKTSQSGVENQLKNKSRGQGRYGSEYIIYSFGEMSGLLNTCARLSFSGYCGKSSAYKISEKPLSDKQIAGKYYLLLEKENLFAGENYGIRCSDSYYYVLKEHGNLICGDAVDTLGKLV